MDTCEIRLLQLPADRIALIRALRLIGRLNLKQAHQLLVHLDRFPKSVLVAGIDKSVAEHQAAALRDAGAEVSVEPSSMPTPMMCTPMVNTKFGWRTWGPFRVISRTG